MSTTKITSAGRDETSHSTNALRKPTKPFQPSEKASASFSPKVRCTGTVGV